MEMIKNTVLNEEGVEATYININGSSIPGIAVDIPGTGKRVLQLKCPNGLLLCGLFSPEKIDGIDFAACVFSAPEFQDMLAGRPLFVSRRAKTLGVTEEMTGQEIAEIFCKQDIRGTDNNRRGAGAAGINFITT